MFPNLSWRRQSLAEAQVGTDRKEIFLFNIYKFISIEFFFAHVCLTDMPI